MVYTNATKQWELMVMIVSLPEMLDARERRATRQQELLQAYNKPMISFTMNIAGPIKDSPLIYRGFEIGLRDLEQVLSVEGIRCLHREVIREKTGSEARLVLDAPGEKLKLLTQELEDFSALGRLYDMDVLSPDGQKLQREEPRRCLICGEVAQVCARSRKHTVAELQEKTTAILQEATLEEDAIYVAALAQQALLYEVGITPKPGLVDRQDNGSHKDMDFFTFQRSAAVLGPYFKTCYRICAETRQEPADAAFEKLRFPGKLAEGKMRAATGGVNTHKGAIFSLGILCGALGRIDRENWKHPEAVLSECARMTQNLIAQDLASLQPFPGETVGQKLYLRYGITGVRGQAAAGFPEVLQIGLPKLEEGLVRGLSLNDAACAALLALIADTVDTNMISRGGVDLQKETARKIRTLLAETPFPDREALEALNDAFVEKNLSPGGCADLLAMTLLLHFLKEDV